jgi:glucan-binding YG repeat protein
MFKRANKITALVVAAASVMSIVPAMAAERLTTKDGTVKQGIAYEDGQYGYYGYRTDSDETGIWYNKGGEDKDSAIEDLDEYEYTNTAKYGEKYAYAINDSNNDDEYLIDLSTGKVLDDETIEGKSDAARSKLQQSLKKAERYNELVNDGDKFEINDSSDFKQVLTGKFGEVWYKYTTEAAIKYDNEIAKANNITTCAAVVLTNDEGKYIDVSVDANMRIYSSKKERAIVIDKYDKDYNDAGLNVRLDNVQVLAQTKSDFYVLTKVIVTDSYLKEKGATAAQYTSEQYFIQKISKARDGQEDGAYLPKSVNSYQLDTKLIYDNGDAQDAYNAIMNPDTYDRADNLYAAKEDTLYVTNVKLDKAKVTTLKLGKVKSDTMWVAGVTNDVVLNKQIDDVDTNLVKKTNDDDHDLTDDAMMTIKHDEDASKVDNLFADNEITGGIKLLNTAVSIDTEGNTWVLDQGKIFKYDGTEFKEMYKVDRNSDSLDAYNDGNVLAYEADGGAYTTVQEGKKETVSAGDVIEPRVTTPATVGWKQETTGWNFYDVNGVKTASKWVVDNGAWYYIKADGLMATGWLQDPATSTWYFLNGSGAMQTGWYNDNGTWYYLNGSGAMLANTTVDGYVLGASGAWVK